MWDRRYGVCVCWGRVVGIGVSKRHMLICDRMKLFKRRIGGWKESKKFDAIRNCIRHHLFFLIVADVDKYYRHQKKLPHHTQSYPPAEKNRITDDQEASP